MMLTTRRNCLIIVVLAISSLALLPTVHAVDYSISYDAGQFNVTWKINAWQNLTGFGFRPTLGFPVNVNHTLNGTELADFTSSLQSSLQQRVKTVTVSQPSVYIKSNNMSDSCKPLCPRQWFNLTINFQIHDNPPKVNNVAQYNMSWKSFKIDDDLKAAGLSYNRIGEKYLLEPYRQILANPPGPSRTITVNIGGQTVTNTTYQDPTRKTLLLDMSRVQIPLDNWIVNQDFAAGRTIWISPRSAGFFTFADLAITEAGAATHFFYFAESRVTTEISGPLNSFARGDVLYIDLSNGLWEKLFVSIAAASLGTLAVVAVVERRLSKPQSRRKEMKRP
ncbi:MAG TPA: hypothetical protein VFE98_00365 [Candidatus Bathyarchaeia archaeon]|nr:hypothetical protein [Candidatus Bathyarchaeia archaeon]